MPAAPNKTEEPAARRRQWWPSPERTARSTRRASTRLKNASTKRNLSSTVCWSKAEPRSGNLAATDADLRGKGTARGTRTHSRTTIRSCLFRKGAARWAREQRGAFRVGSTGTPSGDPKLRRGSILQVGQNVHRVTKETAARPRSTRANRGRAQVRSSSTHSGARVTDVSGRTLEDMKLLLKNIPRCKRRAGKKQGVAQRHAERAHTT